MREAREATSRVLAKQVEDLNRAGGRASAHFLIGAASREIPKFAVEARAGLVVLGRCGAAGLMHVRVGSVVDRVAKRSELPVLVIPKGLPAEPAIPRRLLVGVDMSRASAEALRAGMQLSEELGCSEKLLLEHVFQEENGMFLASATEAQFAVPKPHDLRHLEKWLESHEMNISSLDYRYDAGIAEVVLPKAAREENCDWIVLGALGRTAIASFLIGSTTQRILQETDRPVLVVPPSGPPDREEVG
jgi:nucleotide-binding universal stress UspA family protein